MKKAFTLIELLVVIAIIAILAAILFPVFAQAKMAAKKSADLSNSKQIGIALNLYLQDSDDVFMPSNHRENNSSGNEVHWSWMVLPYMKSEQIFVSPADKIGGWAPGCYDETTNNRGFGKPALQQNGCAQQGYPAGVYTLQVGRISYVANQSVIGRKREAGDTANVVSATAIDGVSSTILLAPATESQNCMRKEEGGEYRSYRPAFGIAARGQAALSGTKALTGEQPYEAILPATYKAVWSCETAPVGSTPDLTLRYTHSARFDKGNNYVMADTSAKFKNTESTFNVNNYLWGKQAYSLGGAPVVNPMTGLPVQ